MLARKARRGKKSLCKSEKEGEGVMEDSNRIDPFSRARGKKRFVENDKPREWNFLTHYDAGKTDYSRYGEVCFSPVISLSMLMCYI